MITNGILLCFEGLINVLLSPLSILTIAVEFIASIRQVQQFLQIAIYLFPWTYVLPLIIFVIGMFVFRIIMSIVRLVIEFIPWM